MTKKNIKNYPVCNALLSLQISESVEGVTITEDGDLNIYKEDKRTQHTWTFTVKTKVNNYNFNAIFEPHRERTCFLAHQIETSDVLPLVRYSYLSHVISPKAHNLLL